MKANTDPACSTCGGTGWVCEDHPDVPWADGDGCCGGAGAPCRCVPQSQIPVAVGEQHYDLVTGYPVRSYRAAT